MSGAVDPRTLVAVTRRLDAEPDLIAIGATSGGVLWTSEERSLAGSGVALRLPYPGGHSGPNPEPNAGRGVGAPGAALTGVGTQGAARTGEAGAPDMARTGDVAWALAAIACDNPLGWPGTGPAAFGALPFAPDEPGSLIVPRRVVGRCHEGWWETIVGPRGGPLSEAGQRVDGTVTSKPEAPEPTEASERQRTPGSPEPSEPPDAFTLTPSMSHAAWRQVIADAVATIRAGELDKVVLARRVDVVANRPFVLPEVLARLTALYPACMIFHVDGFIGASPELLVERRGDQFSSYPLAGTVARSGDRHADGALVAGLLASTKERSEHRIVIEQLSQALAPWCETLVVPEQPSVLELRNVSHLATRITGRLAQRDGQLPTALDLVDAIHPTAAVGGHPRLEAVRYLSKVEGFDRGTYAGPVGWVDARGDGSWALGIRSAHVAGERASMYAGVGVVADSDPAAELAETQLKLQALLSALVRP
jgi:menaquinone-specific isochorismate synthase